MNRLIHLDDLSVGVKTGSAAQVPVLRGITLDVRPNEILGLVGESGSGKSTVALSMMGYLEQGLELLGGDAVFDNVSMFDINRNQLEALRGGEICLVPQNAGQSLTPTMTIGRQIEESLMLHTDLAPANRKMAVTDLLAQVRLPSPEQIRDRHPHELSGGQQQRCAIAMALAGRPRVLLLDEPTTGLDVTTQVHILELLRDLCRASGVAMVFVSHDLGAIARISDRVAVLYAGELMELGTSTEILKSPSHPYTRGLLSSIPKIDGAGIPQALPGTPPKLSATRNACAFAPRCAHRQEICLNESPPLNRMPDGVMVRCHFDSGNFPQSGSREKIRPQAAGSKNQGLLELRNLAISYDRPGWLKRLTGQGDKRRTLTVNNLSLILNKGETLAVVGESGSGKSTILRSIVGLIPPCNGTMRIEGGESLDCVTDARSLQCRKDIQMIFQNPDSSLNPRKTIAEILSAPLQLYFDMDQAAAIDRAAGLLESVRLTRDYLGRTPDQLSGGEKQRVGIARAFAAEPILALCDEVTSALDVSVQAAVLELLSKLQQENGVAYLFVSHDLATVRAVADRVLVLYQGRICEIGPVDAVYKPAFHPYTEALMEAALEPDPDAQSHVEIRDIVETAPSDLGCPFQLRCQRKIGRICDEVIPPAQTINGHTIFCHIDRNRLSLLQSPP